MNLPKVFTMQEKFFMFLVMAKACIILVLK